MQPRSMMVRSWVGAFIGAMFLLAAAGIAWGPLKEGHRGAQLVRDTMPLIPLCVVLIGVVVATRSILGMKVEVDDRADVVRVYRRAWHFGSVLEETIPRGHVDRVAVETHHRRHKGRDTTTYSIELVVRDDRGHEERVPLGGRSSGFNAKVAFAQKLDAFIKQKA